MDTFILGEEKKYVAGEVLRLLVELATEIQTPEREQEIQKRLLEIVDMRND